VELRYVKQTAAVYKDISVVSICKIRKKRDDVSRKTDKWTFRIKGQVDANSKDAEFGAVIASRRGALIVQK